MSQIYDNIEQNFTEGLKGYISSHGVKRVDFCVGYFNLRGWNLISNEVDALPGDFVEELDSHGCFESVHRTCRVLVGMHQPPEEWIRRHYGKDEFVPDPNFVREQKMKIALGYGRQLLLGRPTATDEWTLRRLALQMKEGRVTVKLYLRHRLHAKLYVAHNPDNYPHPVYALMGSSNLTYPGLTGQGELDVAIDDSSNEKRLAQWFDDRWNDRFCIDITQELINIIENSWASEQVIPPYYIYLKTAYHLSQEARAGVNEFTLTPEFKRDLLPFQQIAVTIATKHLRNEKFGGAMIGDVVGLGKTPIACAIAKIYETTFASTTLVICPANLQSMWGKYKEKYDLKMEIRSMAKPIDVDSARYYRLIIIDESHNLRNGGSGQRYRNIKALIERQENNVLLLTATPYNKNFRDMGNQLRLFVNEDQDLGVRPEHYIRSLGGERQFMQLHNEVHIRSIAAFECSPFAEDWSELMKLFLVRRTRTFIKENYAKTDPDNGRKYLEFNDGRRSYFPDRIPRSLKFKTSPDDQYSRLYSDTMLNLVDRLVLPRYGLINYITDTQLSRASGVDKRIIDDLSRAGGWMVGICKSTFFKRIDSDGISFLLTVYRHILRNVVFLYALENKLPLPIGDNHTLPDEYLDDEASQKRWQALGVELLIKTDDEGRIVVPDDLEQYKKIACDYYNFISSKGDISWLDSTYFKKGKKTIKDRDGKKKSKTVDLKADLESDCAQLIDMVKLCGRWSPSYDQKLNLLEQLLTAQHPDEKVIVFTQYSDTAQYLHQQLSKRGMGQLALATGDSDDPTAIVEKFSPISNGKPNMPIDRQYRVVIATDVLSEGQNLQDSHIVVNFDLPWAIIRLIQRAGRVDRIGQTAEVIYCYSIFPAEGVENIIKLRKRLNDRINENARVVGSDEVFFEGNEQNLRDMFNEKSGILDEEEDGDVDLASQAYQIWKNAIDANPDLARIIPKLSNMIYSTRQIGDSTGSGVITYARTSNGFDMLTWLDEHGNVVSQSQRRIMQAMACSIDEPAVAPLERHHELVSSAIDIAQQESATNAIGGMLGNRFSTRHRIIDLLDAYYERQTDLFFNEDQKNELKLVIDDLYNYPLLETAKLVLGQMLRRGQSEEDIVEYVIELRKDGNLCKRPAEDNDYREPTIICSMGLRHTDNGL